jgi:hypothetical protein
VTQHDTDGSLTFPRLYGPSFSSPSEAVSAASSGSSTSTSDRACQQKDAWIYVQRGHDALLAVASIDPILVEEPRQERRALACGVPEAVVIEARSYPWGGARSRWGLAARR